MLDDRPVRPNHQYDSQDAVRWRDKFISKHPRMLSESYPNGSVQRRLSIPVESRRRGCNSGKGARLQISMGSSKDPLLDGNGTPASGISTKWHRQAGGGKDDNILVHAPRRHCHPPSKTETPLLGETRCVHVISLCIT